ncbi:MAG TPA: DNA polymerase III subunit delta, partial [Fibrobacteraceae bacterium]|nr:DNA polymerase III subunit delta [Fibrobacteraceae bacterium]
MICAFLGEDQYSRQQALDAAVAKALGDRKDDPMARQILHAGDTSVSDIAARVIESCSTVSMFGPDQAVVLRRVENLRAADFELLTPWLKRKPDCLLFLEGEKLDGRSEFVKVLKKVGQVEDFAPPKQHKLAEWIIRHSSESLGKKIVPEAAHYLAEAIGNDLAVLHAELVKLAEACGSTSTISAQLTAEMVVAQRELAAFEIQKPFGERNAQAFIQVLRKQLRQGIDPIPILSALHQHAVRLLHTQAMLAERASTD